MKIVAITILIGAACSACIGNKEDSAGYENLLNRVNEYENCSDFISARDLLLSEIDLYPENEFDLLKELVYLNEKLGDYKNNLQIFSEGHKKGYFFLIHPSIPRYRPYIEYNGFMQISGVDLDIRDSINKVSGIEYQVSLPAGYKKKKSYPLVFIFHGGGSNILKAQTHWNSEILDNKYIKVFLQSSRHSDYNTFGWGNSDSIAIDALEDAYDLLSGSYNIDSSELVIAGISAGGTSAVFSAFRSSVPATKVIAICTGIPEALEGNEYLDKNWIEVIMLAGKNDHYRPRQERLLDSLSKYNIQHSYTIISGMGHEYPDDFSTLLNTLL